MKKANKIIAAALSAVIAACAVASTASAYTNGIHDTDSMRAVIDYSFDVSEPYLSDVSARELYYDEADDSFYIITEGRIDEAVFTPAEGVVFEDIAAAFEQYKEKELPDEEEDPQLHEKEYLSKLVIQKDGEKVYAEIPVEVSIRLLASFCQKNAALFESAEYKKDRMYMLTIGEPYCITRYNTKTADEYIMEHELDWSCKSASVRVYEGKGFKNVDGISLTFPENMTGYEKAQGAYEMMTAKNGSALYPTITDTCECTWESTDLLVMSTAVNNTLIPTVAPTITETPTQEKTMVPTSPIDSTGVGDANCDFRVTVADAVAVLQYIANAEKYPLSPQGKVNADIDGIPGITGTDAIAIQCIDAGVEYVPKAQKKRTYSTKEELISLMVSEDEDFSEHGFIYAPGYKFDAVLNAGTKDYLIIYGLDPEDCKLNEYRWGYMPENIVINTADFIYALEPEFYSGSTYMPGALKEEYRITSESGNSLEVIFFIDETAPGFMYEMTDERWTASYGFSYMPYVFPDGTEIK